MSAWTPTGWTVLLGAPWPNCWWGDVGGLQFVLETEVRACDARERKKEREREGQKREVAGREREREKETHLRDQIDMCLTSK